MEDCIFCKILRENMMMKVCEDEWTVAFMDIAKDIDGHILVIPKKHVKNVLDCDEETLSHVMNTVKKVSKHLVDDCGYEGINLMNCTEECAGQTVPHFHMHIIPRKSADGLAILPATKNAKHEVAEIWEQVKM